MTLNIIALVSFMLNVIMLSFANKLFMLIVIMLNVVAPNYGRKKVYGTGLLL
jgi:hypothetical protein